MSGHTFIVSTRQIFVCEFQLSKIFFVEKQVIENYPLDKAASICYNLLVFIMII